MVLRASLLIDMVDITRSVFLLTPQQYFSHPDERRAAPCAVPSPNHNNGRVTELSDGWPAQEASRAGGGGAPGTEEGHVVRRRRY